MDELRLEFAVEVEEVHFLWQLLAPGEPGPENNINEETQLTRAGSHPLKP